MPTRDHHLCDDRGTRLPWREVRAQLEARYRAAYEEHYKMAATSKGPCGHPPNRVELRRKPNANGAMTLRQQCFACGEVFGPIQKKASVSNFELIPVVDRDMEDAAQKNRSEFWGRHTELQQSLRQAINDGWHRYYDEHLSSPEWRMMRARVLARDENKCQGCLARPARHVHHLTYDHLGDELLFELISLCEFCHQKIHPHQEIVDHIHFPRP